MLMPVGTMDGRVIKGKIPVEGILCTWSVLASKKMALGEDYHVK